MTAPDPSPDDAFQRAAEELWTPVYRFALAMTNDLSEADDVAQEAFVRLWGRRKSIDWGEPVLGWLLVTARRIALDRFRRLARAFRLGSTAPRAVGLDAATIERFVDLRAELAVLTPAERTAILLSAVEGWSADEIGAALGISAGAVRAAASRGRAKLTGRDAR
jgi:RNA polymerase sigma-70 factor (ECF subfamily)